MVNEGFSCASMGSPLSAASYIIMLVPSDGREGGKRTHFSGKTIHMNVGSVTLLPGSRDGAERAGHGAALQATLTRF